jgi:hypothetical protein
VRTDCSVARSSPHLNRVACRVGEDILSSPQNKSWWSLVHEDDQPDVTLSTAQPVCQGLVRPVFVTDL